MVDESSKITIYKISFTVCFFLMALPAVILFFWILFAHMATGVPVARDVVLREGLFVGMVAALLAYFKWPWVAVAVSWVDMAMILRGIFTWEEKGLDNFLYQFSFDILFFAAAHVGLFSFLLLKRFSKAPFQQSV
jgi:hypothetical protein